MDIIYPFLWAFGLCLGSFAGMSISRYQRIYSGEKINIVSPSSHCPRCKKSLKPMMLIPIFSYIYLKGKCYFCKKEINKSYLITELIFLTVTLMLIFFETSILNILVLLLIFCILYILLITDYKHFFLPIELNLTLLFFSICSAALNIYTNITHALFGAVFGYTVLYVINFIYKKFRTIDGIGFGDFILLASLGALYGIYSIPFILFFGSLFSLVIYLFKEKNTENYVPFGSGLILGAFLIFLLIEIELLRFI